VCAGVIILRIKDPDRPRPFRVPGGLVLPVLGIISCFYLMSYLPSTSWFRFAAWLNLGFVVYIAYGAVRSRLTGRHIAEDPAQHDAETAWSGATLGLAGLVILFGALAFDIAVRRTQPGGTDESFMNPSWFLLVPLIVNVVLLFPPNIARAKRAIDAGVSGAHRQRSVISMAISAILMVAGIAYLAMVLPRKF
jgi:uncharacterized membrane protein YidH (DUF202 family)